MTTHRAWAIQVGTDDEGTLWRDADGFVSYSLSDAELFGSAQIAQIKLRGARDWTTVPILLHRADEDIVTPEMVEKVTGASPDEAGGIAEELNALIREGDE